MFGKANWPLSCANHTAGFTSHKGDTRIPRRLIVTVELSGCSGRENGSVPCCLLRSREEYCTYARHCEVSYPRGHKSSGIGINYQTHTHTHRALCAHNTIPPRTYNLCSRLLFLLFVWTLQFSLALPTLVSMFIVFRCSGVKISRLSGWGIQWVPLQLHKVYFGIMSHLLSVSVIAKLFLYT
jgi:hypothetical protein